MEEIQEAIDRITEEGCERSSQEMYNEASELLQVAEWLTKYKKVKQSRQTILKALKANRKGKRIDLGNYAKNDDELGITVTESELKDIKEALEIINSL